MGYEIKAKEIRVRGSKGNIQLDRKVEKGKKAGRRKDEKRKSIISPCGVDEERRHFLKFI